MTARPGCTRLRHVRFAYLLTLYFCSFQPFDHLPTFMGFLGYFPYVLFPSSGAFANVGFVFRRARFLSSFLRSSSHCHVLSPSMLTELPTRCLLCTYDFPRRQYRLRIRSPYRRTRQSCVISQRLTFQIAIPCFRLSTAMTSHIPTTVFVPSTGLRTFIYRIHRRMQRKSRATSRTRWRYRAVLSAV